MTESSTIHLATACPKRVTDLAGRALGGLRELWGEVADRRLEIGPLVIMSTERWQKGERSAFEIGVDVARRDPDFQISRSTVRHLRSV